MAADLKNVYGIAIPEGEVKRISAGGTVIWKQHRIPAAYDEVEWVKLPASTANKLLTNLAYTGKWDIILKLSGYSSSGNLSIFGGSTSSGRYFGTNQNGRWGAGSTTSGTYCSSSLATNKTTARVVFDSGGKKVNGTIGSQSFSRTGTATAAIQNATLPVNTVGYAITLYSLIKWNSGETEKLYEGIPCRRRADGYYGIYDTVSGTFCGYPAWTGEDNE